MITLNPNFGLNLLFRKMRKPKKHESSVKGKIGNDCSTRTRKAKERAKIKTQREVLCTL